jgi:hypothetical protein
MKFIDSDLKDYTGNEFKVYKDIEGVTFMEFSKQKWIDNRELYAGLYLGKCESCTSFFKDNFENFAYDKVLVAGLGFGLIPQELSEVNQCSKIDVVEISQEVIDYNISSGHLNSDINLIQGDIYTYNTFEKYDLIIIDTIWREEEMTENQYQTLVSNFSYTNLNPGGVLYVPVKKKWLVN